MSKTNVVNLSEAHKKRILKDPQMAELVALDGRRRLVKLMDVSHRAAELAGRQMDLNPEERRELHLSCVLLFSAITLFGVNELGL